MKLMVVSLLLTLGLLGAVSPSQAQFDMRNSANPYMGMGRTGFALEERDRKLQEKRSLQKAKDNAAAGQQGKQQQPKKQPPKRTSP